MQSSHYLWTRFPHLYINWCHGVGWKGREAEMKEPLLSINTQLGSSRCSSCLSSSYYLHVLYTYSLG